MAQHGDWIPHKALLLMALMNRWLLWLTDQSKVAAYDWKDALCERVIDAIEAYLAAYNEYASFKTPENRLGKDVKKKAAIKEMRNFANQGVRFNDAMTEADKFYMGIAPADTSRTIQPVPASQPDTDVLPTYNHYEHVVRALNHDTGGTTKPADAFGVRYAWQVGGEKPASGAALARTKFSRRTKFVVSYTETEKGQTAFYATCYENRKGDQGTWSPVVDAIIA